MTEDPVPRHQFIVDLQGWLEHKVSENYYIILGIDANEPFYPGKGLYTPVDYQLNHPIPIKGHDGTLSTLVKTSGLVDPLLIHHPEHPPPPTMIEGQKRSISFLFPPVYFHMLRGLAFFHIIQYLRATTGPVISISIVRHFFKKIHPSLVHRSTEASDYRIQDL